MRGGLDLGLELALHRQMDLCVKTCIAPLLCLTCCLLTAPVSAVTWQIVDDNGEELPDAVVQVYTANGQSPTATPEILEFEIAQESQQFTPQVLAVPVGAVIAFPNRDRVAHHVYSFSPAKRFELELYKGDLHQPITFDVAGVVNLGCNIHDSMRGYIVVSDAPWFGTTDAEGIFTVDLPAARYEVEIWHPRQLDTTRMQVDLAAGETRQVEVAVRPARKVRRGLGSLVSQQK